MTDAEREDALSFSNFWQNSRENPVRAFVQTFLIGAFGIGVLAIGAIHFVLGWIVDVPLPIRASIIIAIALLGAVWAGADACRRSIQSQRAIADIEQRITAAIDRGEVCVYSSTCAKSRFDDDANPEHPPLIIDFGNGDTLTVEAMEQDQFQINEEIGGECEVVTLPEDGPILSVTTLAGTRHLQEANAG